MTSQALDLSAALLRRSGVGAASAYWIDALQRSILYLDVLRQRGNIAKEHNASLAPNVLQFKVELVLDGRQRFLLRKGPR